MGPLDADYRLTDCHDYSRSSLPSRLTQPSLKPTHIEVTCVARQNTGMRYLLPLPLLVLSLGAHAQRIGEVDTVFKFIGPDHKIVVEA
jgi:hypothetical protein